MKAAKEKVTAFEMSVTADNGQSPSLENNLIITDTQEESNRGFTLHRNKKDVCDADNKNRLQSITLSELYDTAYQPKAQIIDDFLCAGTYIFAGGPKIGKSFFVAQLGYHVSNGLALWERSAYKGSVLYLALEDTFARLQKRLSLMFGVNGADDYHLATKAKTLREGLDEQLDVFLNQYPDTKLIIIDTLQKVREVGGESYSYSSDYEIIAKLKQFSDKHNICILVVRHTNKVLRIYSIPSPAQMVCWVQQMALLFYRRRSVPTEKQYLRW